MPGIVWPAAGAIAMICRFSFLDFKEEVRGCNEIVRFSGIVSNDSESINADQLENELEDEELEKKYHELFGEFNESEENE